MRAAVTGASGFLGSRLVRELLDRGHEVTALVRPSSDTASLPPAARIVRGDVTDPKSLAPTLAGQDAVFHLAAVVGRGPGGWEQHLEVGVRGTDNVIAAAESAGVRRLVHLSSAVVHGRHAGGRPVTEDEPLDGDLEPWNHYARQKIDSELAVWRAHEQGRVLATTIRPPMVVGPGDPSLVGAVRAIMSSPLGAVAGDGRCRMPVVVADELVPAIACAAEADQAVGRAYHLAAARPLTKDTLIGYFREFGLRPLERSARSRLALGAVALAGRFSGGRAVARLEAHARRRAQHDCVLDCSRAAADLGWRGASDVREAVLRTMEWHRAGNPALGPE